MIRLTKYQRLIVSNKDQARLKEQVACLEEVGFVPLENGFYRDAYTNEYVAWLGIKRNERGNT